MQRPTFTFSFKTLYSFLSQLQSVPLLPPVCLILSRLTHQATKSSLGASMEYSALRLETLALHEVLKAGLPTDQLDPVTQSEVAAWKWIKGDYRVAGVQVRKHRKNCECCPVSQLIDRKQRLLLIQVLNCQYCNQCLKCHKSL